MSSGAVAAVKTVAQKPRRPNEALRQRNLQTVAEFKMLDLHVGDMVVVRADLGNVHCHLSGDAVCSIVSIGKGVYGKVALRPMKPRTGHVDLPGAYDAWKVVVDETNSADLVVDGGGYDPIKRVFLEIFHGRYDPRKTYTRVNSGRGD